MALACEDSRMSVDSELSNMSPCKPIVHDNKTTAATTTTTTTINISSLLPAKDRCLDEETDASASDCTAKDPHPDPEPEEGTKSSRKARVSQSWIDIVEEEENQKQILERKKEEPKKGKSGSELAASDSKMSMDESSNSNTSLRSNGSGRQIEIDILDSANVEKYEKLVRDDKIKSPFKRRLSDGEDGEETCAGHVTSDNTGETCGDGTPQHKKSKTDENDHGRDNRSRRESSSSSSGDGSSQSSRKPIEYEKDLATLERRQKQIDYGKNTLGYENYLKQVPRDQRTNDHPKTPPKHIKYSRRAWDGVVKVWRKKLHCFDPDAKLKADDLMEPQRDLS